MIAQNSEDCIMRSLTWATKHFEEVNVVHSSSIDQTDAIIAKFPDVVSKYNEFKDFSDQWNTAIAMSTKPWVLVLATDEIVHCPWSWDKLAALLESKQISAGVFPRINFQRDTEHQKAGSYPDPQTRLVRCHLRMNGKAVDETMDTRGEPVMFLKDVNMLHWGHIRDRQALKQKHHDRFKYALKDGVDGKGMMDSEKQDWFNERNVSWDRDAQFIESKEIREYAKKWHTIS